MVKLTKSEAKRKVLYISEQVPDYSTLGDLVDKYGRDVRIHVDAPYYEDEATLNLAYDREETDEEYEKRITSILQEKEVKRKKAKQAKELATDEDYQTWMRLNEKYGESKK